MPQISVAPSTGPVKDEESGEEDMLSKQPMCAPCKPVAHTTGAAATCMKMAVSVDHGWLFMGYCLMWASLALAILIILELWKISTSWAAAGIALLLLQQCFATGQLLRAEFNISGGVQPLFGTYVRSIFWPWKSIMNSPIPTDMVIFRWSIYAVMSVVYIVFIADNIIVTAVLFAPLLPFIMSKEDAQHTIRWAGQYGHRRLGIAALLMACPQAVFHFYLLLNTQYLVPLDGAVPRIQPNAPSELLLVCSVAANLGMVVFCWRGIMSAIYAWMHCTRWCAVGSSMRHMVQYALFFGDIVLDVFFAMSVWNDSRTTIFILAVVFIALQYYVSLIGMLWFTWDGSPFGLRTLPTIVGAVLSPLVLTTMDIITAMPLTIAPFVRFADQETWASWVSLVVVTITVPLLFVVEGILRVMRVVCTMLFPHHPTLMPTLPPCECGTVSVFEDEYLLWAESYRTARVHVQAFFQSFFQGGLQIAVLAHYLVQCSGWRRARDSCSDMYNPHAGLVITSIVVSVTNFIRGCVWFKTAADSVGLTTWQEFCLMLGLKAGMQVARQPAELFVHGDQFLDMRDVSHFTHAQQASALTDGIIHRSKGLSDSTSELTTGASTTSSCMKRWELVVVNLDESAGDLERGARCTVQPRVMLGHALKTAKNHLRELEGVHLEGCYFGQGYLEELGNAIKCLQQKGVPLVSLRLSSCNSLTDLTHSHGTALSAIRFLHLHSCCSLLSIPALLRMTQLVELELFQCSELKLLPEGDYGKLTALRSIRIQECDSLTQIPEGILRSASLEEIQVDHCDLITELPGHTLHDFQEMRSLKVVEIWGCMSLSHLPEGLLQLKEMGRLEAQGDRHDLWKDMAPLEPAARAPTST